MTGAARSVRGVLFDVDGTLTDYAAAERAAITAHLGSDAPAGAAGHWAAVTAEHYARFLAGELDFAGQRRARIAAMLAWAGRAGADPEAWFAGYLARYDDALRVFPDVRPALDALPAHLRLGVVSNSSAAHQRGKLDRLGLGDRFACLVCADEAGAAKPDPAIFLRGCAALGLPPADVAYVGDLLDVDARGAVAAGLHGIWLDRTGAGPPPGDVVHLTTLADLPAALRRY